MKTIFAVAVASVLLPAMAIASMTGWIQSEKKPHSPSINLEAEREGTEIAMIEMNTDRKQYAGEDTITLTLKNIGNDIYYFGYPYELERWTEGEWKIVPPKEEKFFIMIAIYLKPGESWKQEIPLDGVSAGNYRIVKQVNNETKDCKHTVYAEFQVSNAFTK